MVTNDRQCALGSNTRTELENERWNKSKKSRNSSLPTSSHPISSSPFLFSSLPFPSVIFHPTKPLTVDLIATNPIIRPRREPRHIPAPPAAAQHARLLRTIVRVIKHDLAVAHHAAGLPVHGADDVGGEVAGAGLAERAAAVDDDVAVGLVAVEL